MKNRFFFHCAYNGTSFLGWQKQPNGITVQETIETELGKLMSNKTVSIVGCGRTDAGVHASSFYFHVDLDSTFTTDQLCYKLNNMMPSSIAIFQVKKVAESAHARFDAEKRTYRYFIHQNKDPFHQQDSWYYPKELDVKAMNKAAQLLLGKKDFTSFSKLHTDVKTNNCEVFYAEWQRDNNQLYFEISANRFLRNMVRAIVGTLLEVGRGEIQVTDVEKIIQSKDRGKAGQSVPAKGLFLTIIDYPYI
jgi:tRNA pseudouridine38-40 synthase